MVDTPTAPVVDQIVKDAQSLSGLVNTLSAVDPALAQQFTGKALVASKSVYGPFVASGITFLAGKYGLGWSPDQCALLAGGVVLLASAAFRAVTSSPITGWFTAKLTPNTVATKKV
jgi:hypothetical protein